MKINTKNCLSISGAPQEVVIRPNQYIAAGESVLAKSQQNGAAATTTAATTTASSSNDMGRQVMYLPSIVYTPVTTSARQRESLNAIGNNAPTKKKQRRLLTAQDMDALNMQLESLFIGGKTDEDDDDSDNDTQTTASTSDSSLGRVQSTAFSYKTNATSNVFRCARFRK